MITHVAWDFDGTLMDSYPFIITSFQESLSELGLKRPYEEVSNKVRVTVPDAARFYAGTYHIDYDRLLALFAEKNKRMDFALVTPFPHVEDALKGVISHGGRNHLYTHRQKVSAERYLDHYGLLGYFTEEISSEDPYPRKPAPDALLGLKGKLGCRKDELMMVGDRPIDIDAAYNAGCISCFYDSNKLGIPLHATYHVDDYTEFEALLQRIMA